MNLGEKYEIDKFHYWVSADHQNKGIWHHTAEWWIGEIPYMEWVSYTGRNVERFEEHLERILNYHSTPIRKSYYLKKYARARV